MPKYPDVDVQLVGQDGNVFVILGLVSRGLRRAGHEEAVEPFMEEATSGDYDHAVQTAMAYVNVH